MDVMDCQGLAVPAIVMQHVADVESSFNRYAIGVVGGRLERQPVNLGEAVATARMLASRGYNFSLGLAQVNRRNLARYGLASYAQAFDPCRNLRAGSRILAECAARAGQDWGRALSCYYSGDFGTGFRHGYVQKVFASMRAAAPGSGAFLQGAIDVVDAHPTGLASPSAGRLDAPSLLERRGDGAAPAIDTDDAVTTNPQPPNAGRQAITVTLGAQPLLDAPAQAARAVQAMTAPAAAPAEPAAASVPASGHDEAFVF
jgi:type IV secretion system protein VirB1